MGIQDTVHAQNTVELWDTGDSFVHSLELRDTGAVHAQFRAVGYKIQFLHGLEMGIQDTVHAQNTVELWDTEYSSCTV